MEKLWIWEDFFCCLRPVIHRHHLLPLDRELWMVHQEDRQPRKIKMRHERNLGQSFLSGHSENMFSAKVATSWQPMNFVSVCVLAFTIVTLMSLLSFWDLTWFDQNRNRCTFLDTRLICVVFSQINTATHVPFDTTSSLACMSMSDFLNMNPQQRKSVTLQYTGKLKQMFTNSRKYQKTSEVLS